MQGQTVRSRTVQAVLTAVLCLTLTSAALRVVASDSARDSDILLTGAAGVRVTGADGAPRDVTAGDRLRKGDTVATGPGGSATLVVDDRRVVLAESTSVVVPDGASLDLRDGSVLVDRRRGPGLRLGAGDVVVDEFGRGGVRVDRAAMTVRTSVYSGGVRLRTSSGRSTELPALHSVGAAGRALPAPVPLALTGSPWEREVIPDVVGADEVLTRLATGVDAAPPPAAMPASVPAGTRTSEALLPLAFGRAAGGDERVGQARALRAEGGSWGVIAAILDASTADVAARLDTLLSGGAPGDSPLAGGAPATPGAGAGGAPSQPPGSTPGPSAQPAPTRSPGPPRPSDPPPTGSPEPSQSRDPVAELVEDVSEMLPSPSPSAGLLGGLPGS